MKYMENTMIENENTTNLLPIVPLRGKVAFPHTNISFEIIFLGISGVEVIVAKIFNFFVFVYSA